MEKIIQAVGKWARKKPHSRAILYLEDGEHETASLSFGALVQQAKAIASQLQAHNLTDSRVMLLYPTGIEFIASLLGCWYAGAIAVPVNCPPVGDFKKQQTLLNSIADDAGVAAVLSLKAYHAAIEATLERDVLILTTDAISSEQGTELQPSVSISNESIAYLQYTSGSTSAPKGVMVTFGNLKHSLEGTIKAWHYTPKSVTLNWAPHSHVYGLVCGLLVPLYHGSLAIIMPPAAFLRKPVVWLAAISKYRVTHSGCPNFGFDVCVWHIDEADLSDLNLKSWKVAVNGGDMVQHQTLTAFVNKFGPYGFRLNQFCSAYGMSEMTGAIASTPLRRKPKFFARQNHLEQPNKSQHVRQLVSSGKLLPGLHAIAVEPDTGLPVVNGDVGEIWLSGKSVVPGYWQRPDETSAVFNAHVPGSKTPYFKTGDLGFVLKDELFLTGRLKEVMVIYGKKYYPLDFENTIAKALNNYKLGLPQAVFSTEISGHEKIIVVQELPEQREHLVLSEISDVVRHAITKEHGVDVHEVLFVAEGVIPKTGSGKLQRKKLQQLFCDKKLDTLTQGNAETSVSPQKREQSEVSTQFKGLVADALQLEVGQIDLHAPLSRYAFDSMTIIQLTTRLNETYQLSLSPAVLYEYQTLGEFYKEVLEPENHMLTQTQPSSPQSMDSDIAIIGMSGIFPGASDIETFWANLCDGKDCIQEIPASRWDWHDLTVKWGGFIGGIDQFDAAFFNVSPHEAELMDPQQRLLLQTVWKTIENAGYRASELSELKTGLFVGVFNHDYAELLQKNEVMDAYLTTGTMNSMIANRISYFLNLRGPSETIDTACSSSLVAIHQAAQAILHGDCEVAIAGGVNALISPTSFISASKAEMLSQDGRCKTFDKKANGYVRGEGVGAILLKKLSQALQDGDLIHGVIKGTAVNHGGHVNTLTAPNPNAQADVIVSACQRAHIPVDSIQYIEAHGTGTPLGDPVEINGLKKAFAQLAAMQQIESLPEQYCGIGTVKTHIGHLESAAGIAGVIKVLMAMRHEILPANLHFDELNPYIDVKESPFYILNETSAWPKKIEAAPRRAGVSSFGFGGTNAHIILEENPEPKDSGASYPHSTYLITLSAKSSEALQQRLVDLLHWLKSQEKSPSLAALSFTLNAGREHFSKRFAVIVETVAQLKERLQAILSDGGFDSWLLQTQRVGSSEQESSGHLDSICKRYLQGETIDWQILYDTYRKRMALPTYPFAKDSHWIKSISHSKSNAYPFIDENISSLTTMTFRKQFIGDELFLRDHLVSGESVLPGTVCLEMARFAAHSASSGREVVSFSDVVWKKPIKKTDWSGPLHVHLFPEKDFVSFAIQDVLNEKEYVSGNVHFGDGSCDAPCNALNITEIQSNLNHTQSAEAAYAYFEAAGLQYGPGFRVVQNIVHDEKTLLAEIALPLSVTEDGKDVVLPPALMDGILQTTQALLKKRDVLYLPFSIEQMEIHASLSDACFVYARLTTDVDEAHLPVFNIQAANKAGNVVLTITGFSLCAVAKEQLTSDVATRLYQPTWVKQMTQTTGKSLPRSVLVLGYREQTVQSLQNLFEPGKASGRLLQQEVFSAVDIENKTDCILVALDDLNDMPAQEEEINFALNQTYNLAQALVLKIIQSKQNSPIELIFVSKQGRVFAQALAGFAKTLQEEQPNISCRIIDLRDYGVLLNELTQSEIQVRYDESNARFVPQYVPFEDTLSNTHALPLKNSGVYLITGGLGGLGYLLATYLAEQYQAKLVLVGRTLASAQHKKSLETLASKGASVLYLQADVSKANEVQELVQKAKAHFGGLNGVIHSAGVTRDSYLLNKTAEEAKAVFAPKVYGTCYLHAATSGEPLDFFALFSSVAAVFGNAGQADYAYANCFLDGFASEREKQRESGGCSGKSLSINWPLWQDGGLQITSEYQKMLEKHLGIVSLSTKEGLSAFSKALQYHKPNILVLSGHQEKLITALHQKSLVHTTQSHQSAQVNQALKEKTEEFLKQILAETLKVQKDSIESDLPFENYGIDSLMIIQLNQRLESQFKALPKTLFFEYQNLSELTNYFIQSKSTELSHLLSESIEPSTAAQPISRKARSIKPKQSTESTTNDIAVIGLSGRYPQAKDINDFWQNLQNGKDCITEVPDSRWDWAGYFDDDKNKSGKTYSKWGGFLDDVDKFDPLFFNISPREAALMDPQERLFLETAWKAIEDAGYPREQVVGKKVGVYVGVMYGQYQLFANDTPQSNMFVPTNSLFSSIANRVSYFFDFHGPSIALDTMCSSSLTAIHLACQSILDGECQMALAGGVNLSLHPNKYLLLSHGQFLASDGHCRSFGEGGDGYVPGEGVGAVLLKPLELALADGDHIYAVIKGSQLNHGGKTNGYTVPNPNAQADLIAETYQRAQVDPRSVSYIEAHGTGTSLGDPIEIAGLNKAFGEAGFQKGCAIGSVKSNIGHCESAAGIAAVTKVLLQLQHRTLVPSILSDTLNSNIDWSNTPFRVQQQLSTWEQGSRVAGISSFGAGGANAHLILAEAPEADPKASDEKSHYLLTLSAKTESSLKEKIHDLLVWLEQNRTTPMADISYTLNACRTHFESRCALVVSSVEEAIAALKQLDSGTVPQNTYFQTDEKANGQNIPSLMAKLSQTKQYRDTLLQLARCYAQGESLDWQQLHAGEAQKKISLPTYPFAKERYWFSDEEQQVITRNQTALPVNAPSVAAKVSSFLIQQIVQILKVPQHKIQIEKNLGEYGMDSVGFVEFANRISAQYQVDFTPAVFYTHNSIKAISQYLLEQFPDAIGHELSFDNTSSLPSHTPQERPLYKENDAMQSVAIIGMQGMFPQSDDLEAFWQHLIQGDDLVSTVPEERWRWQDYYGEGAQQSKSKWGGFLNQVDQFDAGFFNISAREAKLMDPQQRLFLEVAWKAIEDAGYNPFELSSDKVGVFAGVEFSEYQTLMAKQSQESHGLIATGNSHSMIANRVSYFFNFNGPSEAIDTACSSSLVAIHRAAQAISQGECGVAIAGGVSLILNPDTMVITSQLGALSEDGRCKTFDKDANGYVKGEGVGCLLLKPLAQAQQDGDHIYGVIKASAVNHGGKAQSLTAPNALAQSELIINAYTKAAIDPNAISYIETHGTGTALGDPVEIEGLKLAFNRLQSGDVKPNMIALGSVKTNIGHLEPASGIAGVIKLLLAMTHEQIPGLLHLNELNPYIHLQDTPFYIAKERQAWQRRKNSAGEEIPLHAGISSFGFGGTNAHIVLEEGRPYQSSRVENQKKPFYLLVLSAKKEESLQQKIADLHQWLEVHPEMSVLPSLSYTLSVGRAHFNYRCALVVSSIEELSNALNALIKDEVLEYCILNNGQVCDMQGPVFDEVYQSAMHVLKDAENASQYRHKLFILADLYTKHYPIDWEQIYANEACQRIASLPSYPFIKERYWFDVASKPTQSPPVASTPVLTKSVEVDRPVAMVAYLQDIFAEKLQVSPDSLDTDETYEVFGVDSVIGLEITTRLENDFGTLPKTILYERNSLSELAHYLIKKHPEKLSSIIGEVATTTALMDDEKLPEVSTPPVVSSKSEGASRDIAIIGLNGTFPMANTLDEFWHNLSTAKDCITEVPKDRWDYKDYPVLVGGEEKYFPHGGFITDVDKFDPMFFNISPRDAGLMDPQERLFMQSVWATLEDAGYTREKIKRRANNSVGVFAGVTYNFYPLFIAEEWQKGNRVPLDIQSFSVANRISYFLNLNGPSLVLDTACSSSLAAIHLACESILRGDCKMAIAGGVNLSLHPSKYHFLGSFNFMSDKGRCSSFAEGGTGYVPSEGVGAVLLKPLEQAIADNDAIYGVIKGSSMNHGGKTSGYTVPNPNAQKAVILQALQDANIDARTISYIEAHGTGTSLGDPIEVRGLQDAFETYTEEKQYCAIGSVKSNIGHLESAAGVSQLAKVLLQLRHKQFAPSLHAETLNSFIDFENSPFYVQRELKDWETHHNLPRRAGVSSFGAGGANVHMIVEEYIPKKKQEVAQKRPYIFLLSALDEKRLEAQVHQMLHYLEHNSHTNDKVWLQDACYTLQTGRESMAARLAVIAESREDLLAALENYPHCERQNILVNHQSQSTVKPVKDLSDYLRDSAYQVLAQQWVDGAKVDWEQLYEGSLPNIISLPTYPFAKRRCWIPTKNNEKPVLQQPAQDVLPVKQPAKEQPTQPDRAEEKNETANAQDWLYKMVWEKALLEDVQTKQSCDDKWLIFSDLELGFVLQQTLPPESCLYCFAGEQFEKVEEGVFYINPSHSKDYEALFQAISSEYRETLKGVIYLCRSEAVSTESEVEPSMGLLSLFKAMVQHAWHHQLTFCLASQSAQAVLAADAVNVRQHHLWSMSRIFAAEQANYQALLLDLDANESLNQNASYIANELSNYQASQNHIAYRGGERYAIRFASETSTLSDNNVSPWKAPVAALVTGGLGALGYEVAEYLVQQGTRFVLLTGATELSEQTTEKNTWLKQLKSTGASVQYVAVDVADKSQMQQVIQEAEEAWQQPIDGVFHLAGITTDNVTIEEMDESLWRKVLNVKIKGTLVLHELFERANLSSFVLFSSIAAVPHFGMAGLSAYAVANEFMSGLALYRRSQKLPAVSINWVAWSEKGMSHRHNHDAFLDAVGMDSLAIKQGMSLFDTILKINPSEITVCKIHWKKFFQVNASAKSIDFFEHFVKEHASNSNASLMASYTPEQVADEVMALFVQVLALEADEVDPSKPFEQYGMDSIVGIHFTGELDKTFPGVVSPMDLYRYPTLNQLIDYISQRVHNKPEEKTAATSASVTETDLDQLNSEQLNELLELELKELEQAYG